MSGEAARQDMTEVEARTVTDRIRTHLADTWELLEQAYTRRAWIALGYQSWDAFCEGEFGTSRLRLPREERQDVVCSLRDAGMSVRAIAAATGDHYSTVSRDLSRGVANATPEPQGPREARVDLDEPLTVTGLDGKTYPKPKPKPTNTFSDRFYSALSQLQSDALRLQLLTKQDGFVEHIDEVCRKHRDGVVWVHEIVAGVLAQMGTDQADLFGEPA